MSGSDGRLSERDHRFLRQTFTDAETAGRAGERPFAALVAAADGNVLAAAINRQESIGDLTEHAELAALRQAFLRDEEHAGAATLYASSEPCAMCSAGAFFAGVGRIVYGVSGAHTYLVLPRRGRQLSMPAATVLAAGDRRTTVIGPVLEAEGLAHLRSVQASQARQHDGKQTSLPACPNDEE